MMACQARVVLGRAFWKKAPSKAVDVTVATLINLTRPNGSLSGNLKSVGFITKQTLLSAARGTGAGPEPQIGLHEDRMGGLVTRALRNHQLWLAVAYVGILVLMARAYA
jgi:hypothetical protein